jgi:hypothetical protein
VRYDHIIVFLPTCISLLFAIHKAAIVLVDVTEVNYSKENALALVRSDICYSLSSIHKHKLHKQLIFNLNVNLPHCDYDKLKLQVFSVKTQIYYLTNELHV